MVAEMVEERGYFTAAAWDSLDVNVLVISLSPEVAEFSETKILCVFCAPTIVNMFPVQLVNIVWLIYEYKAF
jgi:hypothetical protein